MRRQPQSIILYAFDLLHLDGKDLRQQTLMERRASLKSLLGTDERSRIQFSDEFDGNGDALFKACAERELEGIVSKHAFAPYRSGRSKTWLKTKCFTESTFVVIGTDRDRKSGALRALLAHTSLVFPRNRRSPACSQAVEGDSVTQFIGERSHELECECCSFCIEHFGYDISKGEPP